MRDDQNRIIVAQWNRIKHLFPSNMVTDMTPTFGQLIDAFRINYGIYISATPTPFDDIRVREFRSEVYKISGNDILDYWTGNNQAYYLTMREAIDVAAGMIGE